MSKDAAKLLEEALELPKAARAALAGSLIESLDDEVDEDSEAAWTDRRLYLAPLKRTCKNFP